MELIFLWYSIQTCIHLSLSIHMNIYFHWATSKFCSNVLIFCFFFIKMNKFRGWECNIFKIENKLLINIYIYITFAWKNYTWNIYRKFPLLTSLHILWINNTNKSWKRGKLTKYYPEQIRWFASGCDGCVAFFPTHREY